jgi:hypothetical protein
MKQLLIFCAALVLTFSAASAFASDVTGTWTGNMIAANGDTFQLTFTLKQEADKLSGTVSSPQLEAMEIVDGKIDGDKLSFSVVYNGMTIKNEGVISGEQIKLSTKTGEGEPAGQEVTLTRAKTPETAAAQPACPAEGCAPKVQGAADVTGKWTGSLAIPGGDSMQITFTFKQVATKLTGTVGGPMGDPMEISEGKVDGDKIAFNVNFNGMTIKHDGVVSGDTIKLTTKTDNADFPGGEMTLARAK